MPQASWILDKERNALHSSEQQVGIDRMDKVAKQLDKGQLAWNPLSISAHLAFDNMISLLCPSHGCRCDCLTPNGMVYNKQDHTRTLWIFEIWSPSIFDPIPTCYVIFCWTPWQIMFFFPHCRKRCEHLGLYGSSTWPWCIQMRSVTVFQWT